MFLRKSAQAKTAGKPARSVGSPPRETTSLALAIGIAVAWCVGLGLLSTTAQWGQIEARGFDQLTIVAAPNRSTFPITIVGIDEASFHQLGLQWPWPRSLHADLIDRLTKAGAAVVAMDIVFSEPSGFGRKDDERFADAIKRSGNVVLAANLEYTESAGVKQWLRIDPLQLFTDAGAQTGLATIALDRDLVVRGLPDSQDALWRAIVRRLMLQHAELSPNLAIKPGSMIRYVGADHSFPYVSYHEIVKPTGSIPDDFFKDQIVIVGRDIKAAADIGMAQADLFATPFAAHSHFLVPGAEIHANILETVLAGQVITPVPKAGELALLAFVALACALLMRRWRPLLSAFAGIALIAIIVALDWWLFSVWQLWLPAFATLALMPAMYTSLGGVSFLREQARKREITQAFSLYVTPQVVDQLLAHPEQLKLGGERREVTFMFTDLAGFTTFSEALSAERVVYLLNRHFTEMTDIQLKHKGTVARFIGDAIMAFWGAPTDDDEQAFNAVSAAIEMQQRMEIQREEFVAEGLPAIHMRVGIQSGSAILGNLGSAKRFDYTAIGDDVNLAARLEGTNKLYGTGILIGDATAQQVIGKIPLRRVDRVIVKGKSQPVETFTPCSDAEIVRLNDEAIRLFRTQDWDGSEALWKQLLAYKPGDRISEMYLERIVEKRAAPPGPNWDGAVSLEKL
jgi:adenylate cyclase